MTQDHRIGEANVGHQLLKKMGWEGAGLGAAEQGIQDPIKGGEVRSKGDKYKVNDQCQNDDMMMSSLGCWY